MADEDVFEQWKAEVAKLRLQHEAEILHLKTKHRKALRAAQENAAPFHWSNWRGIPQEAE